VFAAECLDGGGRVHVRERDQVLGQPNPLERFPAGLDLRDFCHVGHGAAGVQVGQDDLLAVMPEHVGAFCHEVYTAENNVLGVRLGRGFGELVTVAGKVGETDDLVALVVMAQQNRGRAELLAGGRNTGVHRVVGEGEVIVQAADGVRRQRFFQYQCQNVRLQSFTASAVRDGVVESL
jgi:hypothetical protein